MKARLLKADGTYEHVDRRGKECLCAQEYFCKEAKVRGEASQDIESNRVFVPKESIKEESEE